MSFNLESKSTAPGQKFSATNESFDIQPAEVVAVNYKDVQPEQIYNITVVPMISEGKNSKSMSMTARPLNYNTKKIPLIGEVVLLLRGPSPGAAGIGNASQNYYLDTYSIQSLIHHNALPQITKVSSDSKISKDLYNNVEQGHSTSNDVKGKALLAKSFEERNDIRPIQPYAGDIIFEGRFNQSIRLSSTLKDTSDYTIEPSWQKGKSENSYPIMIIRNGREKESIPKGVNKFVVESPANDISSIWLTHGQQIPYTPKYSNFTSIDRLNINTFKVGENFEGNQLALFSDRIIIGSKKEEVFIQSEGGVSINSAKSLAMDVEETIELNSSRINLGFDANEPALLGDTTGDWLSEVMQTIVDLVNEMVKELHPTGTGPSGPPINAPVYAGIAGKLQGLKAKIPLLKSELVYLNKSKYTGEGEIFEEYIPEVDLEQELDPAFNLSEEEIIIKEEEVRELEEKIQDPELTPEAKKIETERKSLVEGELVQGKSLTKDPPPPPANSNEINELRKLINATPIEYRCAAGELAIERAILDVNIMEYTDSYKPGGYNGGGAKVEGVKNMGRIDDMLANVNFKNTHKNFTVEGQPWCAAAVSMWWGEAGLTTFKSAGCDEWKNWGTKKGLYSTKPKLGAIILYSTKQTMDDINHVGMVAAVDSNGSVIRSIEGNTGPPKQMKVNRNGNGCYIKLNRKSNIMGFILPPGCK